MRTTRTTLSSLLGLVLLAGCPGPREDDALEPNDNFEQATRIELGEAVEGRANQDNPDVFVVAVEAGVSLEFSLEDRGLENCPSFQVHDPNELELLGQDPSSDCLPDETRTVEGASFEETGEGGYRIVVSAELAGDYYLTIIEGSEADNIAPFGWDYRLTASLVQ